MFRTIRLLTASVGPLALCLAMAGNAHADAADDIKPFKPRPSSQRIAQGNNVVVVPANTDDHHRDEVVVRQNTPMIASGLVTFALAYGISVTVAATTDSDANDRLYVPLLGPWLSLADRPECPVEIESCDSETTKKVLLVVDGIAQAAGALGFVYGLFTPIETQVGDTTVSNLRLKPIAKDGGGGLALSGSF